MKTASAVVAMIRTMMATDGQWAVAAVAGACTGDAFAAFVSTK
jgi:hypothetical protein